MQITLSTHQIQDKKCLRNCKFCDYRQGHWDYFICNIDGLADSILVNHPNETTY